MEHAEHGAMSRLLGFQCAAAGRAKGSGVPSAAPIDLAPRAAAVRDALTDNGGAASAFRSAPAAYEAPASVAAATGRRCVSAAHSDSLLAFYLPGHFVAAPLNTFC